MNAYAYCTSSPIVRTDALGLDDIILPATNDGNATGGDNIGTYLGSLALTAFDVTHGINQLGSGSAQDHAAALECMTNKPDNTYIDGHGGSKRSKKRKNQNSEKTGLWFENPDVPGAYERLDADLAEDILDNQKKDPCGQNPKLNGYYDTLKKIFDNTNDRVCFFSCRSGAGDKGKRLKNALNGLGFGTPFRLYENEVGDPELFWGMGSEGGIGPIDSED